MWLTRSDCLCYFTREWDSCKNSHWKWCRYKPIKLRVNWKYLIFECNADFDDLLEFRIAKGAKVDLQDKHETTLVHMAIISGNVHFSENFDVVRKLIRHGAGVSTKNVYGNAALHMLAILTQKNNMFSTPLDDAIAGGIFEYLSMNRTEESLLFIDISNLCSCSSKYIIIYYFAGHTKVAQLLIGKSAEISPIPAVFAWDAFP